MTEFNIPGKLFLAGEYAITRPGQRAILAAVYPGVQATVTASSNITVTSNLFSDTLILDLEREESVASHWQLAATTVRLMFAYGQKHQLPTHPFELSLTTKLAPNGDKLGYGSSAAVVVAIVKSLHDTWGWTLDQLTQFKLAATAHLFVQQNGSLGDVASSTFGGLIVYQKPDITPPLHLDPAYVDRDWPQLAITPLSWPESWHLAVFETHQQANTQYHQNQNYQQSFDADFWSDSNEIVDNLQTAFTTQDLDAVTTELAFNQALLAGQLPDAYITDRLADILDWLMDAQTAGKISGSGFGDNAFAIVNDQHILPHLPHITTRIATLADTYEEAK
jgi:phosphomevalonate kinase